MANAHVLVMITPPPTRLTGSLVDRAAECLDRRQGPKWLARDEAAEVTFGGDPAKAVEKLTAALADVKVDWAVLPAEGRRKKLLVADMDSTMVTGETLDELAAYAGVGERVAEITGRSMRGEIDFAAALIERVALLEGVEAAPAFKAVTAAITPMPGAETLVRTMRRNGAHAALVSGGFTIFTGAVRERLGFDVDHANALEVVDGRLTGRVIEPILGREAKLERLTALAAERGLDLSESLAVGDGANDLAMIAAAGLGVAFHAKPIVAAAAAARVTWCDLTALLYLQGYAKTEFVTY